MLALSIRQPYAELILRAIKTVEYRTQPTRIIGERFYIDASKAKAARPIWSDDLRVLALLALCAEQLHHQLMFTRELRG